MEKLKIEGLDIMLWLMLCAMKQYEKKIEIGQQKRRHQQSFINFKKVNAFCYILAY